MSFLPQTLDIDHSIFERNLRIVGADETELDKEFNSIFAPSKLKPNSVEKKTLMPSLDMPSIQVTPDTGICVKTKNIGGVKVFLNFCKIQEIPPAPAITEEKLKEIISSDDYSTEYRVPMSLGEPREAKDKAGNACLAADVALNTTWFEETMENSLVFTTFTVNIAMEGLKDKYGDDVNLDRQNWVILKNKKYMGELQKHHIQQRAKGNKIQEIEGLGSGTKTPLISEIPENRSVAATVHNNMTISAKKPENVKSKIEKTPKFCLIKHPVNSDHPDYIMAEVSLDGVFSQKELTLDVGQDRLIVEARRKGFVLDIFLPYSVNTKCCKAAFVKQNSVLYVKMPVLK